MSSYNISSMSYKPTGISNFPAKGVEKSISEPAILFAGCWCISTDI